MEVEIAVRRMAETTVVAVTGELDVYTAPQLDDVVTAEIDAGHTTLVLDFTQVEFLDSIGLGVVVRAVKSCRVASGSVSVVVATERIRRIFEITGLDKSIRVGVTLEEVAVSASTLPAPMLPASELPVPAPPASMLPAPSPPVSMLPVSMPAGSLRRATEGDHVVEG